MYSEECFVTITNRPHAGNRGEWIMDRRTFIKVAAAGSGFTLVPGLFSGCGERPVAALEGWNAPQRHDDIRIAVLSYALLAPSPHNKQPWLVALNERNRIDENARMELYVDPQRLLPETDPPYRQIHIGQGTFLENLALAAAHFGYRADIDYFPRGMYGNTVLEQKPVAVVDLVATGTSTTDPLFEYVLQRQSNKRVFADRSLSDAQIDDIRAVLEGHAPDFSLTVATDAARRRRLVEFATEAMRIEVSSRRRIAESVAMFRFNDEELARYRDGFGVPQMGADGIRKYLIEQWFISRESFLADDSTFAAQSVDGTRSQAQSAAAFGWLVSKCNTRLDQVVAGRLYNRIALTAAAQGVAIHPLSQVLQEYADMTALQQRFKTYLDVPEDATVQMFFRLGIADPVRHTARRSPSDLLMR